MARKSVRGPTEKVKGAVRKLVKQTGSRAEKVKRVVRKLVKKTVGVVTGGEKRTGFIPHGRREGRLSVKLDAEARGKANTAKGAARKQHRRRHPSSRQDRRKTIGARASRA